MAGVYPFVNFKMAPTGPISSTPLLIFGNDQYTCLLDGILLCNLSDNPINVTLSIAREIEVGVETNFTIVQSLALEAYSQIDVLLNASLTLEPGDLLYANSDFSGNLLNAFVSYRELTELTASGLNAHQSSFRKEKPNDRANPRFSN